MDRSQDGQDKFDCDKTDRKSQYCAVKWIVDDFIQPESEQHDPSGFMTCQ